MGQSSGKGRTLRLLMLLACPLTLIGCVSIKHRPASWGPLSPETKSSDCGGVAGIYRNNGEDTEGQPISLAVWLDPKINHWNTPERTRVAHQLASALQIELGFV